MNILRLLVAIFLFPLLGLSADHEGRSAPLTTNHHELLNHCQSQAEKIRTEKLKENIPAHHRESLDRMVLNFTKIAPPQQSAKVKKALAPYLKQIEESLTEIARAKSQHPKCMVPATHQIPLQVVDDAHPLANVCQGGGASYFPPFTGAEQILYCANSSTGIGRGISELRHQLLLANQHNKKCLAGKQIQSLLTFTTFAGQIHLSAEARRSEVSPALLDFVNDQHERLQKISVPSSVDRQKIGALLDKIAIVQRLGYQATFDAKTLQLKFKLKSGDEKKTLGKIGRDLAAEAGLHSTGRSPTPELREVVKLLADSQCRSRNLASISELPILKTCLGGVLTAMQSQIEQLFLQAAGEKAKLAEYFAQSLAPELCADDLLVYCLERQGHHLVAVSELLQAHNAYKFGLDRQCYQALSPAPQLNLAALFAMDNQPDFFHQLDQQALTYTQQQLQRYAEKYDLINGHAFFKPEMCRQLNKSFITNGCHP